MTDSNGRSARGSRGLSLVEALAAIVILQIAVLGLIYTVTAGHAHAAYAGRSIDASQLGQAMMEEILGRAYIDPEGGVGLGPDAGESSRTAFDDIDDYNGINEAAGSLSDANGDTLPQDMQSFTRSVTVALWDQTITDLSTTIPGKLITVTVTDNNNQASQVTLLRFVCSP